jgi:hypothetical protein
VNYFKTRGVNVYLFEMPINYKLIKLTNYKIVSNQMYIFLPPQKYFYITSDSSLYETTDGLHLEGYEARKYSSFLKAQVMKLNN